MPNPSKAHGRLADRLSVTSDVLRAKPHPDLGKLGDGLPHYRPQEGQILPRLWPRRAAAEAQTLLA